MSTSTISSSSIPARSTHLQSIPTKVCCNQTTASDRTSPSEWAGPVSNANWQRRNLSSSRGKIVSCVNPPRNDLYLSTQSSLFDNFISWIIKHSPTMTSQWDSRRPSAAIN
jgi:hypothetical protein